VRERRIGRILDGYDSIVTALSDGLSSRIRLGAVARDIEWRPGAVGVRLSDGQLIRGRAVIVTVPVGVLAAPAGERGAIRFEPSLPAKESAIASLTMGGVTKIALRFDEPFWAAKQFASTVGDERLDTLAFLHGPADASFPIWWTTYPVRSPLLVGWCGGPASFALSGRSRAELEREALRALSDVLPVTVARLKRHLVSSHTHDWNADPFSRGAYSYARVGGADAAARLARPVEHTIYFAGEGADSEGRNGTVHGAIASGQHAAELLTAT
jgi:monoamine oxidase